MATDDCEECQRFVSRISNPTASTGTVECAECGDTIDLDALGHSAQAA